MNAVQEKGNEIFQDLRERKLLPVVAILVVLIIAVPLVLRAGAEEPAPPTELAEGLKPMLETEPVVLTSAPELRDFRTRLDSFEKQNPFDQPQPVVSDAATEAIDPAAADAEPTLGGATTDSGATTDTTEPTATDFPPAGATSTDVPVTDPVESDVPTDDPVDEDPVASETEVISYDIDVEIGKTGDEKTLSAVEIGSLLPGNDHPIAQFVSTDLEGTYASFVISPDVSGADGDGNCAPSRRDCQFLKLSVGEGERLFYEPNGETYRLKLTAITRRVDVLEKLSTASDDVTEPIDTATQWMTG